eukprot:snap_masked-scaffold_6-processed-gene-11.21-mRNA-1 protein AED:1.00 eAED:1.00 QI:0/0/0/0/1/1/2/0/75
MICMVGNVCTVERNNNRKLILRYYISGPSRREFNHGYKLMICQRCDTKLPIRGCIERVRKVINLKKKADLRLWKQ